MGVVQQRGAGIDRGPYVCRLAEKFVALQQDEKNKKIIGKSRRCADMALEM